MTKPWVFGIPIGLRKQDALHRVKRLQNEGAIMTTAEKLYADDPLVIQKRLRDEWTY